MKKYIYVDLFHLSLVLSLLRLYPNLYRGETWDVEPYGQEVYLGDSTAYTQTRFHNLHNNQLNGFIHPKNVDDAYERSLFIHDVNSLCRRPAVWNSNPQHRGTNIFAYIVNELQPNSITSGQDTSEEPQVSEAQSEVPSATELTQADMDLIEILWKQDIDMGVSRDVFDGTWREKQEKSEKETGKLNSTESSSSSFSSPWQGLNYSIDSETGEHIVLPTNDTSSNAVAQVPTGYTDITLEEALSLFETGEEFKEVDTLPLQDFLLGSELPYSSNPNQEHSLLEELNDLQQMVSQAQAEEQYESLGSHYIPISPTYNETDDHNNALLDALLQNTTLALPMNETLLNNSYNPSEQFGLDTDANINNLLSFLNNDSDPNPVGAVGGQDQMNLSSDLPIANLTVDTNFLTQLLNEENMDFSDLNVLPSNPNKEWRTSMSSDSAVSSMGSDWSNISSGDSSSSDAAGKNSEGASFSFHPNMFLPTNNQNMVFPKPALAAPKKYHLFGKQQPREDKDEDFVKEETEQKYVPLSVHEETFSDDSYSMDFSDSGTPRLSFMHNHTYHLIGDAVPDEGASQKPLVRDKPHETTSDGSTRSSRDEKRLRKANLPLTLKETVELPIERFNERLTELNLTEEHANLLRDIRRRGKNKLAARTCRKRKIDQISELQMALDELFEKRNVMRSEMEKAILRRDMLKQKYQKLYSFIFPDRDPPDPIPSSSLYSQDDSVVPASQFPLSSNGTSANDTEHNKRGKHKGADNK